ncbi:MAG: Biotin/lipoate A/B protein ligase [Bathelium mastoideum]|nr:MAG: Biotin/lipoate A/B protein ligase [Bathelium mastoideum]
MPFTSNSFQRFVLTCSRTTTAYQVRFLHSNIRQRISSSKFQSYLSASDVPFVNLAFEQYLLKESPLDSVILFLYINRPSVIIGSNQNPWLEVNLRLLRQTNSPINEHVDLVRRHSGGGAVFHDHGNVNWTVICPSSRFTRDRHAEMVVRAMQKLGVDRARVNERHDIVLDQGDSRISVTRENAHCTPFTAPNGPTPLKVSGSAYKLVRGRALHHGTCLLDSPNLESIGRFLHSPTKPFIRAKGVESVRSPVSNIGASSSDFTRAVREEFGALYNIGDQFGGLDPIDGPEMLDIQAVRETGSRLKDLEWIFTRTPQFEISASPSEINSVSNEAFELAEEKSVGRFARASEHYQGLIFCKNQAGIFFQVRNGIISKGIRCTASALDGEISSGLIENVKLHEIEEWEALFPKCDAQWLNSVLPPLAYDRKRPETFHSAASQAI